MLAKKSSQQDLSSLKCLGTFSEICKFRVSLQLRISIFYGSSVLKESLELPVQSYSSGLHESMRVFFTQHFTELCKFEA